MSTHFLMFGVVGMILSCSGALRAQTASSPSEGLCAVPGTSAGVMQICWWGKAGRSYFLQTNPTLHPLTWSYADVVETGANSVLSYSLVQSTAQRMFVRLVYTDSPNGGNAALADFDGDGLTNAQEVAALGPHSDPFVADSDWDGYSDSVEALVGTGANNQQSSPNTNPPSGPLNPDPGYRYGLRLDYANKYMSATYSGSIPSSGTASHSTQVSAHHASNPIQWIQPSATVTTGNTTSDLISLYEGAGFLSPAYRLFNGYSGFWMDCNWSFTDNTQLVGGNRSISSETNRNMIEVTVNASPGAPGWARRSLVLLLYESGWTTNFITKAGRIMVTPHNLLVDNTIKDHAKAGSGPGRVVISPKLEAAGNDDDPSSNRINWFQDLHGYVFDLDIEPDANMAGVIGDLVPSIKPDSLVRHFVTPKKSAELPQDHVELKAGGVSAANFTTFFEWDGDGQQGSASNQYKVSRAETGSGPKKVKIKSKQTGDVVAEMHVWVVWCSFGTPIERPLQKWAANIVSMDGTSGPGFAIRGGYDFRCDIIPQGVVSMTELDRPDLSGPPEYSGARISPPGKGSIHFASGGDLDNGVGAKWDMTRIVRCHVLNPNLVPKAMLLNSSGVMFQLQPIADDFPAQYPALSTVIGNDDADVSDESNVPYSSYQPATDFDPPSHNEGELSSTDYPTIGLRNAGGSNGNTFEVRFHFNEFVRMLIGQKWYVCSAYKEWKLHASFVRVNGAWGDGQSALELNNAGF